MNEIDKANLTNQTKIRLDKISETKNFFHQEINQRKSYSKKLINYLTAFDYMDNVIIVLSARTGGVSIISFTIALGAPVGIASESLL